jgi:ribonuclease G
MIFNCVECETRIAVLDDETLLNLYVERTDRTSIVGNIYVGKVVRILPGLQSAFVDIGLERTAFLYAADMNYGKNNPNSAANNGRPTPRKWHRKEHPYPIEGMLKEGQEILVQVAKEPIGNKGARITTNISLPGRNLVLLPESSHTGISKRINDEEERTRLQKIIEDLNSGEYGFIARTASEGKSKEELKRDLEYLVNLWKTIKKKQVSVKIPSLVYREPRITLRAMRDLYNRDTDKVIVDSRKEYEEVAEFMDTFMPDMDYTIELYGEREPIFDFFGIEPYIKKILNKRVWLKSGGYLVIEETEALCSIDVNTGKYVGKTDMDETILKTNLEAVKEIAYQLPLRNIGGIIIIDFIDMGKEEDREKVFSALKEEFKKDRNKTEIYGISELGLIEMTRQRTEKSLGKTLCKTCRYCCGTGIVKSNTTVCCEIFRELDRKEMNGLEKMIYILAHPDVANMLSEERQDIIERFQDRLQKKIHIKADTGFHQEYFEIISME